MGCDNVELLWCGLCLINALIALFAVLVVILLWSGSFAVFPAIVRCVVRRNTRWRIRLKPCSRFGKLPISILLTLRGSCRSFIITPSGLMRPLGPMTTGQ